MRSKRVPDRVHVVRTPEQDSAAPKSGASIEIVRMLAQISDKLKRSEAERYELLNELREYRKSLRDLEDKTENSEKAYLSLENKLKAKGSVDSESLQRQAKFEKALKSTEEKMIKAIAGQALIDKRLKDTEDKQTIIDQRLDESVTEQTRLDRQLEITSQDKARMLRKVERLEEIVTDTQDTLQSKAMVLLTDQSAAASLKAPAWGAGSPDIATLAGMETPWWRKAFSMQSIGMTSMIVAALLGGWTISQMQKPQVPQIAVLENGGLAKLNLDRNRWEPIAAGSDNSLPSAQISKVSDLEKQTLAERLGFGGKAKQEDIQEATITTEDAPDDVLDYNDDQLLAALNNDPEQLAGQLNEIEPQAVDSNQEAKQTPSIVEQEPQITAPMKNFDRVAFVQDKTIEKAVQDEKSSAALADRIKADNTLPDPVKSIEQQAFSGNGEAQHDLAAIYTAGHGGVDQNFEKAGFWFRESSDNGVANARYNLGVLYHQGLGKKRDLARALYWYREAAELGHAEAQYNLGIAHIEGIGTNYEPKLAAEFFERAANNGIVEAAYNLGLIYENGLLGEAKPDEALLWYKISADQGNSDAKSAIEQLTQSLQIGMDDVNKLVERMQAINESVKGRRAGPLKSDEVSATLPSINSEQAIVAQVQEYLMLTGAYTGPADGINGEQTANAIRAYQTANNLPVDGEVTLELLTNMVGSAPQVFE